MVDYGMLESCINAGEKIRELNLGGFDADPVVLGARESIPTQKGVAHPKCPRRRARMFLAEIEPDGGYDKRTFECVECGNVLTKVVKIQIGAKPRLGITQFFLGICELNEEDEGIYYNSRFVFALGFAFGYGARAAVYLFFGRGEGFHLKSAQF